jgi:hypothetical protein
MQTTGEKRKKGRKKEEEEEPKKIRYIPSFQLRLG